MPVPNVIANPVGQLFNLAWDALQAGTLFEQNFAHDSVKVTFAGKTYIAQIDFAGTKATYPIIVIKLKQLP